MAERWLHPFSFGPDLVLNCTPEPLGTVPALVYSAGNYRRLTNPQRGLNEMNVQQTTKIDLTPAKLAELSLLQAAIAASGYNTNVDAIQAELDYAKEVQANIVDKATKADNAMNDEETGALRNLWPSQVAILEAAKAAKIHPSVVMSTIQAQLGKPGDFEGKAFATLRSYKSRLNKIGPVFLESSDWDSAPVVAARKSNVVEGRDDSHLSEFGYDSVGQIIKAKKLAETDAERLQFETNVSALTKALRAASKNQAYAKASEDGNTAEKPQLEAVDFKTLNEAVEVMLSLVPERKVVKQTTQQITEELSLTSDDGEAIEDADLHQRAA